MVVFAGPRREQRTLTFISPPVGPYTEALQTASAGDPDGALRHDTVWACVNKIALSMSMMRPLPYRGPMVGFGAATALDPPRIMTQPSADAGITEFTYSVWLSLMLRGNVFGIIASRDRSSLRPDQIELQDPDQMRVKRLSDGRYEYKLRNTLIDPATVWHKAIYRLPGQRVGMSPIEYAARATKSGQTAEEFGYQWFAGGGHPTAVLTNKNAAKIEQSQAQTVKSRFMAAMHGSREPVVLASGWEYQAIQIRPDESQFLNTQSASSEKICRFFGMKPQHIGLAAGGSHLTYTNLEDNLADFLVFPLTPWIVLWEQWLGELLPRGQYAKCDTSPLLRTDLLSRWRAYDLMVGSRAILPDEVRELDDRPPMTDEQRAQMAALGPPPPRNVSYPTSQE
jgi:HK97 family phage portal protein